MYTFLVCGFPRSGLTWVARFLRVPHKSMCLCDGLVRARSAEAFWFNYTELCWAKGLDFFGNAQPLNLLLLPSLLAAWPTATVVWIERDVTQAMRSAAKANLELDPSHWRQLQDLRDRHCADYDVLMSYEELAREDGIRDLWDSVLPGVPFNRRRWEAFVTKRITCSPERFRGRDTSRLKQLIQAEAPEHLELAAQLEKFDPSPGQIVPQ
jgi:hypothetical protein